MTIVDRVKSLCKKRDISLNDLENELNFGKNSIYRWKERNPSIDKIDKVASYFNVSTDYLLGRTNHKIDLARYNEENEECIKCEVSGAKMFETIAAHAKNRDADLTEEDLKQINDFVNFIIDKHKK
ncbi:helix-turn-helix domain-containing protein [Listeria monocytogenes]|uniref:helix-turn-helix domain-containing protein n=1 Tax=Listeria monocytogenes TaxID=1639 RepID=UPI0008736382|nr:helix-turn-helix transcriptional regulator [Listeria monocytogenes]EAC8350583.1 XRE family transcriptional regulator [Listeria monocytogenes]EAD0739973.1 XRE family transcriptional regulator [Listeria monocytogenes]EAD9140334.1 XRE family transcriptional regulator [Listeria monocytogenes]EIL9239401.1 helix-turn-helix transcriptional regulator [Listeria monocytogenes]EJC6459524.1 helix-turn-helix transcriptional regulator [Listeria monocytogenes]